MDRDVALQQVKEHLTEERYQHTLGVMETAIMLAKRYGVDENKAQLAAIFHDYAKFRPKDEMRQIIISEKMPEILLEFHPELWHAPVGAYLVEKEQGIIDQEITQAIRYHTSGRPQMTMLEKVIYLADYMEPGRDFPGVEEVRTIAKKDINQALFSALRKTILFLLEKKRPIYPDTFHAYNYFLLKQGGMME